MRTKHTLSLALIAGLGIASLTGCSGGGGAQTVAEACDTAESVMSEVQSEMSSLNSEVAAGDFSSLVEGLDLLEGKLGEAVGKVTNEEVKSALSKLETSVADFAAIFDGVEDGDLTALADKGDELQTVVTDIQEAGTELGTLCSA
ncbi:hypothetical protein [Microbacterium sp. No. 7]|uniref:hypothetical protein n=1 Tax=Microbacterium sp. No. 7 TaxID=1714373 RepID=UPI0006ECD4A6|nr:hypothetical protein [Microbacterium sp. No. 7]ALJ20360.1 hypothetical protein AOA12_10725 [Microbacterium sp. No. 7]